ncbi:hypothetical protein C8Q80DRAFT_1265894 [Daedaleopsis nitida]|nr:hypothetical protein C8Q80DRAFT_1265894 [Daedaleopsis nitida]
MHGPDAILESHATIQHLPHELLANIITIVATPVSDTVKSIDWLSVRLVCRDAGLWSHIHAYENVSFDWLRLCQARSAQAPLDLYFFNPPEEVYEALFPLLSQIENSRRIRSIQFPHWTRVSPPFLTLYYLAMPSLEHLEAYLGGWSPEDVHLIPILFPRLHTLELAGVSFPKHPALFANIRSLALHGPCCLDHTLSLEDLLAILGAIHRLESLTLLNFELSDIFTTNSPGAIPLVHLPYLSNYRHTNSIRALSRTNNALSFPSTCTVCQTCVSHGATKFAPIDVPIVDILAPTCIRRVLENAVSMAASCAHDIGIMISTTPTGADPWVRIESRGRLARFDGLEPVFGAFVPFCPSDRLTSLKLTNIETTHPVAKWAAVFRAYPTLRSITLVARCDVSNAIAALTPQGPDQPEDRQELLCPALRQVDVMLCTRTNKVLRSLSAALWSSVLRLAHRGAFGSKHFRWRGDSDGHGMRFSRKTPSGRLSLAGCGYSLMW